MDLILRLSLQLQALIALPYKTPSDLLVRFMGFVKFLFTFGKRFIYRYSGSADAKSHTGAVLASVQDLLSSHHLLDCFIDLSGVAIYSCKSEQAGMKGLD